MQHITQSDIKNLLWYDPESGVFRWRNPTACQIPRWAVAGCRKRDGYIRIVINGVYYAAHRLVWLYMHGSFPSHQIDHINGIRTDNRRSNLREATAKQNNENITLRRDNTSGYRGVTLNKKSGKWQATVQHKGVWVYCGLHQTAEIAANTAEQKRQELFTHHREVI
jgi:hypothetical protein